MGIAKIFCDNCDKWHEVNFEYASDLPDIVCPKCISDSIWFGDITDEDKDDGPIEIGRGGRRQK